MYEHMNIKTNFFYALHFIPPFSKFSTFVNGPRSRNTYFCSAITFTKLKS